LRDREGQRGVERDMEGKRGTFRDREGQKKSRKNATEVKKHKSVLSNITTTNRSKVLKPRV
jgi:hypothetical protein